MIDLLKGNFKEFFYEDEKNNEYMRLKKAKKQIKNKEIKRK